MKDYDILVVEDEFISALEIISILKTKGFNSCNKIASGKEAIEIIIENKPDLLLLDIYLKDNITGIDVAWKANIFDIPFVFITASSDLETIKKASGTNPSGIIIKPFTESQLINAVKFALS